MQYDKQERRGTADRLGARWIWCSKMMQLCGNVGSLHKTFEAHFVLSRSHGMFYHPTTFSQGCCHISRVLHIPRLCTPLQTILRFWLLFYLVEYPWLWHVLTTTTEGHSYQMMAGVTSHMPIYSSFCILCCLLMTAHLRSWRLEWMRLTQILDSQTHL